MQKLIDYPYILSESLLIQDKDFYLNVSSFLNSRGFKKVGYESKFKLPRLVILSDSHEDFDHIRENDVVICLKKMNMELFTETISAPVNTHFFEVHSLKEIIDLWPLMESSFSFDLNLVLNECLKEQENFLKSNIKKINLTEKYHSFMSILFSRYSIEIEGLNDLLLEFGIKDLKVKSITSAFENMDFGDSYFIETSEENFFLEGISRDLEAFFIIYMYYLSQKFWDKSKSRLDKIKELKSIFPIPVILIDSNKEVLFYNTLFSELNFSVAKCLELFSGSQVEIQKKNYRVIVNHLDSGHKQILFFPVDNYITLGSAPNSQELGIISSSLAHELNNPLGGVLAALNVLELDINDNENLGIIHEMKDGVSRCKELVETFLGFSRLSPIQGGQCTVEQAFNQAVSLLRFRAVETNLNIKFSFERKNKINLLTNQSLISMMLYLIISELMTALSHLKLLKMEDSYHAQVKLVESKNYMALEFPKDLDIKEVLIKSKFLGHLAELSGNKLSYIPGQIKLSS